MATTGIIRRLPGEVSGPETSNLPRYVPGIPVTAGLVRRYAAASLPDTLLNQPVIEVPDLTGQGAGLHQLITAGRRPVLKSSNGLRFLDFDAADDWMYSEITLPQPFSVIMLARLKTIVTNAVHLQSDSPLLFSNAPYESLATNAGSTLHSQAPTLGTTWHMHTAALNGANSRVQVDNSPSGLGNAGTGSLNTAGDKRFHVPHSSTARPLELLELMIWNRALSEAESNSIYAALKSAYRF